MSTDALALAQLELLYRLGVIEREHPTSSASSTATSSSRRPSQLPRAAAASVRAVLNGPEDQELRIATAVRPHSLTIKQFDGDSDYDNYGGDSTRTPLHSILRARAYGSAHMSPPRHRDQPTQPVKITTPAERHRRKPREQTRVWFLYWKLFVRNAREKRSVRAIWRFHVKKRVLRRWRCIVQYQRHLVMQRKVLQQWKAVRLVRKWRVRAAKHRQIQLLLGNLHFALMNRLRRRRVWLRWLQYAAQSRNWNVMVDKQSRIRKARCLRFAWLELKVLVCRSKQTRRGLRKFLQALQRNREVVESKRCLQQRNRMAIQRNIIRRLLRRWWKFAELRSSTLRLQRQVAFGISRRRYFRIWRACVSENRCVTDFRTNQAVSLKHRHLAAWSLAAKALRMARTRAVWTHRSTRELHFCVWKREIALARRLKSGAQGLERFQVAKALARLRTWVTEGHQQRRIGDHWRLQLLKKVWCLGFIKFHQRQQIARAEQKILKLQVQRAYFAQWIAFRRMEMQNREVWGKAVEFSLRNQVHRHFVLWKLLWRQWKFGKEQLSRGDRCYCSRLMQKGVNELSALVDQRNENMEIGLRIRRQTRLRTKARTLRVWKRWIERRQRDRSQVVLFHAREQYQCSWFNPYRRTWKSWRAFTAFKARMKQAKVVFQGRLKRKCLTGWRRRTHIVKAAFIFQQQQSVKTLETSFATWQSRASHWLKTREVFALASAVFRRKWCGKILRGWAQWARKSTKVRRRHHHLKQMANLRMLTLSFQAWSMQFQQRSKALQFAAQRLILVRTRCLREWHQYVSKHVRLKRNFGYFQQVFGRHPTTSLVRLIWKRWARYTRTKRRVKSLCRRQHCQSIRNSWMRWRFFHLYSELFREWRRVATQSALDSHEFGKRLRQFHVSRRVLLKSRMLREWEALCKRNQSEREALKAAKHGVLRAIVFRSHRHTQARSKYLRKWFLRWHTGIFARSNAAKRCYEAKLARKLLIAWWRMMVNAKQELVLAEAKQVLGSLSFYHPQQKLYTKIVKEKALSMRAVSAKSKRELKPRNVKTKRMRRMLDPEEKPTYSSYYVPETGRVERSIVNGENQQSMVAETHHVSLQTRDPHVMNVKNAGRHRAYNDDDKESRRHMYTGQPIPQHFASEHQDDRVGEQVQFSQHWVNASVTMTSELSYEKPHVSSRPETSYSLQYQESSPASQSSGSMDRYYQQTCPEASEFEELPLFDPLTPPRPLKQETSRSDKPHTLTEPRTLRQQDEDSVQSHEQSAALTPLRELKRTSYDNHELPLCGDNMHRNGRPSTASSTVERQQLHLKTTTTHVLHHSDHSLLHSSRNTAQEEEEEEEEEDDLPPPPPPLRPLHPHQRSQVDQADMTTQEISLNNEISLEQLASLELFRVSSAAPRENSRMPTCMPSRPLQLSTSTPGLSLDPHHHHRSEVSKVKKLPSALREELSLSTILELPGKGSQLRPAEASNVELLQATLSSTHDTYHSSDSSDDILNEVLAYYAQPLVDLAAQEKDRKANFKTRRQQICFRVLRDLGLFHSRFYFPQMESVMEAISTEHIALVHERMKHPIDKDDMEHLSQLESEYLKGFLTKCIEKHPLNTPYSHSDAASNENRRRHPSRISSVNQVELQWLIQVHLQPRISEKATPRHQRNGKPFWVHSPLPSEVEFALPKLLLCISKYFKVLVQLFSMRPPTTRSSQRQHSNAQQLTKTEFTQLLKHVHVFPQLLNRREVESAFDSSCCLSPDQKEISFPEFVEALIRCSASLQWGEAPKSKHRDDNDSSSETGVVVKFLMLLFAMEGRGSVLQKRNEDLQVVIGYLEQQQKQKKAGRMVRFRKLLVDQKKHQGARPGTNGERQTGSHHRDQLTWMASELNTKRSVSRSVSPRRGLNDGNLFYCTQRGGNSNGVYNQEGERLFDLALEGGSQEYHHLADEFLQHIHTGKNADESSTYQNELASPPDTAEWHGRFLRSPEREYVTGQVGLTNAEHQYFHAQQPNSVDDIGEYALPTEDFAHSTLHTENEMAGSIATAACRDGFKATDTTSTTKRSEDDTVVWPKPDTLYRVGELRDKNDFLDEILTSIGDVELVLQQSNLQLHRHQSQTAAATRFSVTLSSTAQRRAKSVDEYSDDFENDSAENYATSNVMRTLFTDASSNNLLLLHQMETNEQLLLDQVEDVRVHDPMLNQLTNIERFTDSTEWRAYPTLENIAELGVHAVSPTSLYQVTLIQDSYLNDLTDSIYGAPSSEVHDDDDDDEVIKEQDGD